MRCDHKEIITIYDAERHLFCTYGILQLAYTLLCRWYRNFMQYAKGSTSLVWCLVISIMHLCSKIVAKTNNGNFIRKRTRCHVK